MGRIVDTIGGYQIIRSRHGFIVAKKNDFDNFHTHGIKSRKTAESLIYCVTHDKIPHDFNIYLLKSLIRLSCDEVYKAKVDTLIEIKQHKGKKQSYFNPCKGEIC